jgi:tetratricopeptide (TPR) repeat protein
MRRRLIASAACLVLLTGCATGLQTSKFPAADPPATSAYGMFLAGQGALRDGRSDAAARYFDAARGAPGADEAVAERAFTAALLAGDIPRAATLVPAEPQASEAVKRMGVLVRGVEALAQNKGKDAYGLLTSGSVGFPHRAAAALLAPWAAAQAGDLEASLARPQVAGDKVADWFGGIGRGLLFERAGRFDEAETDLKAATSGDSPNELAVLAYGEFLERRGRRLDAVALYESAQTDGPSEALTAAKARAAKGRTAPPILTPRQGAAQALLAPTATMVAAKQAQIALAYLRLILRLDPARSDAWLMVGDLMQAGGDVTAAREAYGRVPASSTDWVTAQGKLAWTYQEAGDSATALKLAAATAAGGDPDAKLALADLYRANERFQESADLLTQLIRDEGKPDWRLLFGRAVAYERLGRWPEAEADLQVALKVRPDDPELLNYLGYSWIDRGVRLKEALAMVEKAVGQNPNSGAMMDSLGWAYYRLGDYPRAVERLEAAVELDAGDPEINDHLGDAYWKIGRRDEAHFQWRRVLTLKPAPKQRASAEAKLASPLGSDLKVTGQ